MKFPNVLSVLVALVLLLGPLVTRGQWRTPSLGAASSFALFTAGGAVSNTGGLTSVIGDVGTNDGAMTGYAPTAIVGRTQVQDDVTATATADVRAAYTYLAGQTGTAAPALAPAMGGPALTPQTLPPGLYRFGGAASVNAVLVLDGQQNPNAVFVFQINGALTAGAAAEVQLINGATPNHVFWQVNGAASFATNVQFAGIVLANGAVSFGDGAKLQGKGLSTLGAISTYNNVVTTTNSSSKPLPVELTRFTADAQGAGFCLQWTTASEKNSAYFVVERSTDGYAFAPLGRVPGQGTTSQAHSYRWADATGGAATVYYRLQQVGQDGTASYSPVRFVTRATATAQPVLQAYPNPFQQQLGVRFGAAQAGVATLRLTDALGRVVAERTQEVVAGRNDLALDPTQALRPGLYLLLVQQGTQQGTLRVVRE